MMRRKREISCHINDSKYRKTTASLENNDWNNISTDNGSIGNDSSLEYNGVNRYNFSQDILLRYLKEQDLLPIADSINWN